MPIQVSPLGLPLEYPTIPAPPKVAVSGTRRLGPWGLAYTRPSQAEVAEPSGAVAPGQAGTVVGQGDTATLFAQVGPQVLASPNRNIVPKVGNDSVTLPGAQALAQGEELEGFDITVRIDGAQAITYAAPIVFARPRRGRRRRLLVLPEDYRKEEIPEEVFQEAPRDEPPITRHIPPGAKFVPGEVKQSAPPERKAERFIAVPQAPKETPERKTKRFISRPEEKEAPVEKKRTRFINTKKPKKTLGIKARPRFIKK